MARVIREHPDQATVRRIFDYDQNRGCLTWREANKADYPTLAAFMRCKKRSGEVFGTPGKYAKVQVVGNSYLLHRIVWIWHHGDIPLGMLIDHINGETRDNRIENLRIADTALNAANQKKCIRNSSGFSGVSRKPREKCWTARCMVRGISCTFSGFGDASTAKQFLKGFQAIHGFTDRHGE